MVKLYKVDYIIPSSFLSCNTFEHDFDDYSDSFKLDKQELKESTTRSGISYDDSSLSFENKSLNIMKERIEKYKKRGFTLIPKNNIKKVFDKVKKIKKNEKYYFRKSLNWNLLLKDKLLDDSSLKFDNYLKFVYKKLNYV